VYIYICLINELFILFILFLILIVSSFLLVIFSKVGKMNKNIMLVLYFTISLV
jgi:hypothetical protein